MTIPIFIITKDRVTVLKQCIKSYLKLVDVEIVIHDNNSTYPPMLEYLKKLEDCGVKVYRNPDTTNTYDDISDNIERTIRLWYKTNDSRYYIVTDPDVELEEPSPKLLSYYTNILKMYPQVIVVGPMLRIDDIPDCFKFKKTMVKSHIEQFWGREPTPYAGSNILFSPIDTTFGMYRKEFKFKRLNMGIRVYEPYMAKHLDWYQDSDNLTEEEQYYRDHASLVSTLSTYNKQGYMG